MNEYNEKILNYIEKGFVQIYHAYTPSKKRYSKEEVSKDSDLKAKLQVVPKEFGTLENGEEIIYPLNSVTMLLNQEKGLLSIVKSNISLEEDFVSCSVASNDLYYVLPDMKEPENTIPISKDKNGNYYSLVCEKDPSEKRILEIIDNNITVANWPKVTSSDEFTFDDIFEYMAFIHGNASFDYRGNRSIIKLPSEIRYLEYACKRGDILPKYADQFMGIEQEKKYVKTLGGIKEWQWI